VDILAFFSLETVWATFGKIGQIFFKSFGHPDQEGNSRLYKQGILKGEVSLYC
jgi:hypothetical protein